MRRKFILRAGTLGHDPDAWVLGVYFTPSIGNPKRGTLTIGGPKTFQEQMDAVLQTYFGCRLGIESSRVTGRGVRAGGVGRGRVSRKRLVFDVEPMRLVLFLRGLRELDKAGVAVARVVRMGRLLR